MVDDLSKMGFIKNIAKLKQADFKIIIVHGGGPFIGELFDSVGIESEFVDGHRKTDEIAMKYVEMALSGQVNNEIVKLLNQKGVNAVGLSGKDDDMVRAIKRFHKSSLNTDIGIDLGHVGDVKQVNTRLINLLIRENFVPVIAPIGVGIDSKDYNINADMFAGHLAGVLKVDYYIVLTDVDGYYENKDDSSTLIPKLTVEDAENMLIGKIQGGMIPKLESCVIALNKGAKRAHIVNGMKSQVILDLLLMEKEAGTEIIPKVGKD